MQLYPGQNPVTGAVTIHLTPGYGLWPTPEHGKNLNPQGGAR